MPKKTRKIDLSGQRFGSLIVTAYAGTDDHRNALWKCKCDCGKSSVVRGSALRAGNNHSCGCMRGHRTHGLSKKRSHKVWLKIRQYAKQNGIPIHEPWLEFKNFMVDMGERPEKSRFARRDKARGYYPDNCYWHKKKGN